MGFLMICTIHPDCKLGRHHFHIFNHFCGHHHSTSLNNANSLILDGCSPIVIVIFFSAIQCFVFPHLLLLYPFHLSSVLQNFHVWFISYVDDIPCSLLLTSLCGLNYF